MTPGKDLAHLPCPPHRWQLIPAAGLDFILDVVRIRCDGCGATGTVTHEYLSGVQAGRYQSAVDAAKRPQLESEPER